MRSPAFIAALVIVLLLPCGCGQEGKYTLTEVIPDDYATGNVYYIVKDSKAGKPAPIVGGAYIYDYTVAGNVYDSFDPYRSWRKRIVVTKGGKIIVGENGLIDQTIRVDSENQAASVRQPNGSFAGSGDDDGAKMIIRITPAP